MAIIYMTDQCCPCEGLTSPCCAPPAVACCMYPADQLGVGYGQADLPDSITITIDGAGGDSRIATKSGSEYVYGSYGAIPNLKLGVVDDAWQFIPNADNLSAYVQPCLFDTLGGTADAEFTINDNFADTYTVEFLTNKQVVVNRESLCSWFGTATIDGFVYEAYIVYNDANISALNDVPFGWVASFNSADVAGAANPIDGNLSSPVGTYSGEYIITVSE